MFFENWKSDFAIFSRLYCLHTVLEAILTEVCFELYYQVNAHANGPDAGSGSYAQGGYYNRNGRVAKAGVYANATTGRAEGELSFSVAVE